MFPFKEKWKMNQSVWIVPLSLYVCAAAVIKKKKKKKKAHVFSLLNGLKLFEWVNWQDKTHANDKLSLYDEQLTRESHACRTVGSGPYGSRIIYDPLHS